MKKLIFVLLGLVSINANAAVLSLVTDNSATTLPGGWTDPNGPVAPNPSDSAFVLTKADIENGEGLYANTSASLTYEYLGKEASYKNTFFDVSGNIFFNQTTSVGSMFMTSTGPGKLDFGLGTDQGTGTLNLKTIQNAVSAAAGLTLAIFVEDPGKSYIVMLGDGAGDSDYDDMIVRITGVSEVPLPGAVWLFGSGLAGVLGLRKRRAALA